MISLFSINKVSRFYICEADCLLVENQAHLAQMSDHLKNHFLHSHLFHLTDHSTGVRNSRKIHSIQSCLSLLNSQSRTRQGSWPKLSRCAFTRRGTASALSWEVRTNVSKKLPNKSPSLIKAICFSRFFLFQAVSMRTGASLAPWWSHTWGPAVPLIGEARNAGPTPARDFQDNHAPKS